MGVSAGRDEQSVDPADTLPSQSPSSTVTKHWGSAVRWIQWVTESDGAQVAGGEDWSGSVRPCSAGGYEARITTGDRVGFYPRDGGAPTRKNAAGPGFGCVLWRPQTAGGGGLSGVAVSEDPREEVLRPAGRPQRRGQT